MRSKDNVSNKETKEELRRRNSFSYKVRWKIIRGVRNLMIAVLGEKNFDKLRGRNM